jgi:hypothetical protein
MKYNNIEINPTEVEVTERSIVAEDLIDDLHNGLTWLKKDDLGYGSIEEKYNANPYQIKVIRKLPTLQNVKTKVTIFNVESRTKKTSTKNTNLENKIEETELSLPIKTNDLVVETAISEAASLFASL